MVYYLQTTFCFSLGNIIKIILFYLLTKREQLNAQKHSTSALCPRSACSRSANAQRMENSCLENIHYNNASLNF